VLVSGPASFAPVQRGGIGLWSVLMSTGRVTASLAGHPSRPLRPHPEVRVPRASGALYQPPPCKICSARPAGVGCCRCCWSVVYRLLGEIRGCPAAWQYGWQYDQMPRAPTLLLPRSLTTAARPAKPASGAPCGSALGEVDGMSHPATHHRPRVCTHRPARASAGAGATTCVCSTHLRAIGPSAPPACYTSTC